VTAPRDYYEKDFYKALGVAKDASASEIKKTYRKLARELHPDSNPGDAAAEARFKEISEAYHVLSDAKRRKEYDEAQQMVAAGAPGGFGGAGRGGSTFDMSDLFGGGSGGNLSDLFDGLFGGAGGGTGTRSTSAGPQRGRDEQAEVSLSFADAARGTTLPLRLSGPATCTTCRGSGAKPGTSPRICPTCGGSGNVGVNQGGFSFSQPCPECRGAGRLVDDPCPECRGSGVTTQTRSLTVRIPSGVRDGGRIKLAGKGGPGRNGAPAGDLYVTVHVAKHELFGRSGDDLTLTVPITFTEAALGTTVRVPTLDGSVSLKVAAGTPSGRTLRVRGRGVKTAKRTGDLLVTVTVAVPQSLNSEARSALEAYAAAQPDDPRPEITAALGAVQAPRGEN